MVNVSPLESRALQTIATVKEKLSGNAADLKSRAMERLGFAKPVASETSSGASPESVEASPGLGDETSDLVVDRPETEEADEGVNA